MLLLCQVLSCCLLKKKKIKPTQCGQSAGVFTYCQQEVQGEASLHPAHIQSAKCLSAVL